MPLAKEPLISSLTVAMAKQNISAEIFANDFATALEVYVRPILNMTGGNFLGWFDPRTQIVSISRTPTIDTSLYGINLASVIETSFRSIQTRNQIGPVQIPEGMLAGQFVGFFQKKNPTSQILAIDLGTSIDIFARGCVITSVDVTSGGTPVTGPIL